MARLLPCTCALCAQTAAQTLCQACRDRHFNAPGKRCIQCALPLPLHEASTHCGDCLAQPPAFDTTIAASDYAAPADQLVLALKFGHQLSCAPLLSALLRDAILHHAQADLPDLLCAVPLGKQRLQERGFNQALEIARPLARQLGIPLQTNLLYRCRETAQQSTLAPDERAQNVRKAFLPHETALSRIQGAHIAVVDDVMTTGMTLHEIATMLKRFGAAKISNYVFARTPLHSV